jgi:Asp-tRNA(Asn)/Glu-tRNA(Gln) amidotransferase C subunit
MDRRAFEKLCELARLELSADELAEFEHKFRRLLDFVEQLRAYTPRTEGPPLTLADRVELRRDMPQPFDWPEDFVHDYRVPKIIDFEGDS